MYSIKAIASLTGLGAETLRAWERRYQAIVPGRNESGRRFYSQQDLERLILLANLTRRGHAISKVSALDSEQLQKLLNSSDEKAFEQSFFTDQIVEALTEYRIDRCEQLLKRGLIASEPLAYIRDILAPTLNYVGQLWHEEKLNVAQEHMFSACVKRILLSMVNIRHSLSGNRPGILFATPSGEPHEFGILMCCLLAAEQDFNCYYLGADVPADDMMDAARKLKVDVIVLSLLKCPPEAATLDELNKIVAGRDAEKVAVWLGGKGTDYWWDQQSIAPENCGIIADFDHFHAKVRQQRYGG